MRFGPNVVEHAPFSIPMIGNTATGYVIGLTPEGAAVCHRMFAEDVPEAEVAAVNLSHLRCNRSKGIRISLLEDLCRELHCQPGDLLVYEPPAREEQD